MSDQEVRPTKPYGEQPLAIGIARAPGVDAPG
jgi:hypothetical protein